MRRCTLSLFALLLGSLQLVAQPTVKTNYANLTLTNTCDGSWSDFNFQVSGYDNQAYHFTYSGIDLTNNIKFGFRLAKPMGGPIYNEIPFAEFTTTANTIRWTIAHTNIPPTGVYYGELLAYSASGTNVYRSLAQGKVNVTWSLYLIDEDYFAVVSKTGASVGQVYVHPTWIVPPWSETEQVVAIQSDLDAHKTNTDVHAIAAVTGLQDVLDGKSGTGDVAQVATDLSEHKSAIGIAVHGLGTMSTQATDAYYTAESVDTLLIGKQDAGDYQASSTNLDAWSGVGPGAYYDSSEVDTILVGKASTGDMATAESDISNLQSEMSSVTGNVAVLETWTNVVIDTSNRVAALEGYTNEVLSLTGRVEILSTQLFAGSGTTGLVTSADGDADKFLKSDGTWTTPEGAGDFKADGTIPMTGNMDHGGHYVTNFGVARGATGIFENALSVGGSAVLTNEPEWEASSSVVMRVVADFGGVSNLSYSAGTNAEAARAIATNALHIAGTALQPGAAGTSTNLGDYNNDAGFITEDTDTNAVWGNISGTMSNQVDLQGALNGKAGTNDLHIVETNAEAARAIATNAQAIANAAIPKTWTNAADVQNLTVCGGIVIWGTNRLYLGSSTNAPWIQGLGTTNIMFGAGTNTAIFGSPW